MSRSRARVGWLCMAAACSAGQAPDSTTVRVRVSVQDSPGGAVVAVPPRSRLVAAPPPRVITGARDVPTRREPTAPRCGFDEARDPRMPALGDVALGHGHTCARLSDGTVRCWGWNLDGETGNGTTGSDRGPAAPGQVVDVEGATEVCTGFSFSCARYRDGTAECWGNNTHNQIRFSLAASCTPHPTRSPVDHIRAISCGGWHVCAIRDGGQVWCWGEDAPRYSPYPVRVPGAAVELSSGWHRSCARTARGEVYCWTVTSRTPRRVEGFASPPTQLSVAEHFACAVTQDRRAVCWGDGYRGELGNGAALESQTPVALEALTDVRVVSAHQQRACALTGDGAIWCWGVAEAGARGRGSQRDEPIVGPTRVDDVGPSERLFVGERHACALARSGPLCCWGDNGYGQLGDNQSGPPGERRGPVAVTW